MNYRSSVDFRERIAHLEGTPHFHLHYADLGDSMSVLVRFVPTRSSNRRQAERHDARIDARGAKEIEK